MRLRALVFALAAQSCLSAHAQQAEGGTVFNAQCVACHQPNGRGVPGNFPALAHNPDIFLARDYPARVVLFGLSGKIDVRGNSFDGVMPPLGGTLTDDAIAAVVAYVRSAWGNAALAPKTMQPLDAATVAHLRKLKSADQVYAYREKLKAAAKN